MEVHDAKWVCYGGNEYVKDSTILKIKRACHLAAWSKKELARLPELVRLARPVGVAYCTLFKKKKKKKA